MEDREVGDREVEDGEVEDLGVGTADGQGPVMRRVRRRKSRGHNPKQPAKRPREGQLSKGIRARSKPVETPWDQRSTKHSGLQGAHTNHNVWKKKNAAELTKIKKATHWSFYE